MSQVDHLTKRPICPQCKTNELTEEELKMGGGCWYCKAERVVMLAQKGIADLAFPDTGKHGRENIDLADYEARKKLAPAATMEETQNNATATSSAKTSAKTTAASEFTPEDIEHAKRNFGIDYNATLPQTDIIVFGGDERTSLRLTFPIPISTQLQQELKEMLDAALGQIGNIILYQRHFKPQLDKMKQQSTGS